MQYIVSLMSRLLFSIHILCFFTLLEWLYSFNYIVNLWNISGRRRKTQTFKIFFTGMVNCYSQDPKWINKILLNLAVLRLSNRHQMEKKYTHTHTHTHTHTEIYVYMSWFSTKQSQFSCSVVSVSLWPHRMQHTRLPCPSTTPGAYSNSCPSSRWCHSTILSSIISSSCFQFFPALRSFTMRQFFTSDGQSFDVSASALVLPMNIQGWFALGWTGWISLQSKGLSRVFSSTTVQKYHFFGTQLSLQSNSHIHTWPLGKP